MPGVSEVASIGGYVKQYQVVVDPNKLRAYNIPIQKIRMAIQRSNNDVGGRLVDMGTDFDDFSARATAYATDGVSPQQQANRAVLREAMAAGGLTVYSGEWWHFDGPGAAVPRPILDVPIA